MYYYLDDPCEIDPTIAALLEASGPFNTDDLALVFTDIVGSTSLLYEVGDENYDEMLTGHVRRARESIAAQEGGRLVDTIGDGVFATFPYVFRAIAFVRSLLSTPDSGKPSMNAADVLPSSN
ncbi:MAG: adenylate/guanylate cyclase domain-containing protein [Myxococcota bacterium]|nr:adenylate/guanylate cyclase domain-containing protein [Myxococcota bacterium]